jgi:2-oxoglutarate ferredoxin oxidoreductase subunit alpha
MSTARTFIDDLSIVLGGEAGQGIQTIEQIITRTAKKAGYHVFSTGEFMSRIRGGSNSTEIRISSAPCASFVNRIDLLIPLDADALPHLGNRIDQRTVILGDSAELGTTHPVVDIPFASIAAQAGGKLFVNSIAAGLIAGLLGIERPLLEQAINHQFRTKDPSIIEKNITAAKAGYEAGSGLIASGALSISLRTSPEVSDQLFMSGNDAVGLGSLAGGCNFLASYPMSPGTGLLTFMAVHAHDVDIIVEQAEDEIAALNMALGAWYAGARAMVSTSGGGFALMGEAVSLAGMIESPAVIHIGMRPGPATGLPTRTEQGDLELARYSGHGEFPRAIFAPGTLVEAFLAGHKAFEIADRFQVPAFILTDQFLLDSSFLTGPFDFASVNNTPATIATAPDYLRYAVTADGISPRGIPGNGDGLVRVDSDEHTEEGLITENSGVRVEQMDKRLRKMDLLRTVTLEPAFEGPADFTKLIVCWGSTYTAVKEAMALIADPACALLHFMQVYPLHPSTIAILERARTVVCVENNATGQFANLIKVETGFTIPHRILSYDGFPFPVELLVKKISEVR